MEPVEAFSLVIFYAGAFIMPLLAARIHVPAAVGEILFGVAVGSSGLAWVHPTAFTDFLSDLGFIFLMFLVGMEIDFDRIEKEGVKTVALATLVAASTLGVGAVLTWRLDLPFFLALVFGAMSVGILLVSLVEVGASRTRFGQMLLLVGSIGEFLTLLALTGYNLIFLYGVSIHLAEEILKALFLFVVAYSILSVLRLLVWWFPHRFRRWVDVDDPSEIGVRAGFVLMLSLAAVSGWVGLEAILGAFLAGALFSYVFRDKGILETKLTAVGQGFFVPLFFINVGVSFEMGALGDVTTLLRGLGVLAAASLVAKLIPAFLLILVGLTLRQVASSAFLLAAPLTLLVAAAEMGHELGVLDDRLDAEIVLLAIVSGIVFPTIFKLLCPRPREREGATGAEVEGSNQ
jgi:Kef-type K+ transport system membrane component KefB